MASSRGVAGGGGMWYWGQRELKDLRLHLISQDGLQGAFHREYSVKLSKQDESISSTWHQVSILFDDDIEMIWISFIF